MARNLSKSKYMSGDQCEKRLWLEINDPDKATPMSQGQERILEQGTEVGILAREQFPGGILIGFDRFSIKNGVTKTKNAISEGASLIFEATFLFDDTYAITDIIKRNNDGSWDIIEVKSATSVHDEYYPDLAVQKYVLEGSGLKINKCKLMFINNKCIFPDLSDLFDIEDLTNKVDEIIQQIPSNLQSFKELILQQSEPNIVIGPHCSDPYDCPFIDYCWGGFRNMTVFEIPRISEKKQLELRKRGILTLDKLPPDYQLSETQRDYVSRILNKEINVDSEDIRQKLSELIYPVYFLDFETFNPAIPRFNGMSPYNQFPFQYSCFVMQNNGDIDHFEYLHLDGTDPREPLIQSLLACMKNRGSIICYSAFEKTVIKKLADAFPNFSDDLNSIAERLWDQKNVFDYHYKDYRFKNKNSLKNVLPVLIPKLRYDDLAVKEGTEAQVVWEQMIKAKDETEKEKMIEGLKAYCKMDTLAMVEIHKHLLNQLSLD